MSDVPDYCPVEHDYELWEIIWALEIDPSHAKDPAEKAELALDIGWHRKKLQDPREPEAIAWWEDYAVWRNIWGFEYELTKESDPGKRAVRFHALSKAQSSGGVECYVCAPDRRLVW